ncbi:MAG: hypothetical protein L0210_02725 [Rhodospirillales bacterium]|nr:hypothetical protein [Rhodospirillales bacterium]
MSSDARRRRGGWLALALGVIAIAAALWIAVTSTPPPARRVTLTAGVEGTTRTVVARALAREVSALGTEVEVVEQTGTQAELSGVDSGRIDFALVSGAYRIERYPHVRQVAPLYVEALHLLVKEEHAGAVGASLAGLRGRVVDIGPHDATTAGLAVAVLAFSGVPLAAGTATGGAVVRSLDLADLEALVERGDRGALPDAVFHLATVPSKVAQILVRSGRYRLVPLPFADAFRLSALVTEDPTDGLARAIERPFVVETVIPGFAYGIDPASPPAPLQTLGTRLLLVCHERVSPETAARFLDATFTSRFAHVVEPPLNRSLLALPQRIELHPGTIAFANRDKSIITADSISEFANTLSVLGAIVGASIFLGRAWRQRRQARTDDLFGAYMLRVAEVERKAVELELSASMALGPVISLQSDLLQLQSEALERYAAGELGSQATLSDLLAPVNAARNHVGDLLLHLREDIEETAQAEGRTAGAVWAEAVAKARKAEPGA